MSVRAAFLGSGARNAGTPFEIASTPESATAPDEKARSSANNVTPVSSEPFVRDLVERLLVHRQRTEIAEERPVEPDDDERGQRNDVDVGRPGEEATRLLHAAQVADGHERRRRRCRSAPGMSCVAGNADVMAATPAETDTATVST